MTRLVDWQLHDAIEMGDITLDPYLPYSIQPNSIDVRLGDTLVDPATGETFTIPADGYPMQRFEFLLGTTMEYVTTKPWISGDIVGKSSVGRSGLMVECAGLVDNGFEGQLTLELLQMCAKPVILTAGMWIAQLVFQRTYAARFPYGDPFRGQYGNHYQGQRGPTLPHDWDASAAKVPWKALEARMPIVTAPQNEQEKGDA